MPRVSKRLGSQASQVFAFYPCKASAQQEVPGNALPPPTHLSCWNFTRTWLGPFSPGSSFLCVCMSFFRPPAVCHKVAVCFKSADLLSHLVLHEDKSPDYTGNRKNLGVTRFADGYVFPSSLKFLLCWTITTKFKKYMRATYMLNWFSSTKLLINRFTFYITILMWVQVAITARTRKPSVQIRSFQVKWV